MSNLLAVFIGGGLGSILRYGLSLAFNNNGKSFPIATFLSNLIACLILGFVVAWLFKQQKESVLFVFLSIGVCGGFSTFSTFSLEGLRFIQDGNISMAIVYSLSSLILGLLFIYSGYFLGQKFML